MKVRGAVFSILTNPTSASIKRIAWAYGCAKKGSLEEEALYTILIDRVREVDRDDRERVRPDQ